MSKLLHIYSFEDLELSRRHSDEARNMGFEVVRVGNDATLDPEQETELFALAESDELQGVWLDLPFRQLTVRTERIALVAGNAGKLMLGRVPAASDAKGLITMYIGKPDSIKETIS